MLYIAKFCPIAGPAVRLWDVPESVLHLLNCLSDCCSFDFHLPSVVHACAVTWCQLMCFVIC